MSADTKYQHAGMHGWGSRIPRALRCTGRGSWLIDAKAAAAKQAGTLLGTQDRAHLVLMRSTKSQRLLCLRRAVSSRFGRGICGTQRKSSVMKGTHCSRGFSYREVMPARTMLEDPTMQAAPV